MRRLELYVFVDEGVYPVCEDTLLLLSSAEVHPSQRFLEMGCGTGLIGLHAAAHGAETALVDIDPKAVACARKNALENNLDIEAILSNLFENVSGCYDVISFNPPYLPGITSSGDRALDGGEGGVEVAARFLEEADAHLSKEGVIYLLLSSLSQKELLKNEDWLWNIVASKKLFFEELTVYRLTRPSHSPNPSGHAYKQCSIPRANGK